MVRARKLKLGLRLVLGLQFTLDTSLGSVLSVRV